jgi:nucleoside-diphosphate-sugar epimerase
MRNHAVNADHVPSGTARRTRLVVGCGYLGGRVAARWAAAGDLVYGVTRSPTRGPSFAAAGIVPIVHDVASTAAWPTSLPAFDTVFWAVGFDAQPPVTPRDVHVLGLGRLLDSFAGRPRVILSSSTGVWGDEGGNVVNEQTPVHPAREAGRVLVEAETLLRGHPRGPGVALRFAGLYGPGRLPRLDGLRSGTPIAADPDSWLNLIHVDDAAGIVAAVADAPAPQPLYVVSDGRPVRRRDWYGQLARAIGSPEPSWDASAGRSRGADKRVDPALLFGGLPIRLAHPDPLAALAALATGAEPP